MPSDITSPGLSSTGGFRATPTPGGVPVVMMSPGSSVMYRLTWATRVATEKIMVRVFPVCMRVPFTSSHMSRTCGSGISSVVTSHGPIGPAVSKPLPLSHCPVANWKARSDTSFTTQ